MLVCAFLFGCNKDDSEIDANRLSYNLNDVGDSIRSEVADSYASKKEETKRKIIPNQVIPKNANEKTITPDIDTTDIEITDDISASVSPALNTYSTQILTTDSNRYNNIKIVADKLNGFILNPGQTFSFNEVCGPYGKDDGFLEATILLSDGTEDKGYGGGVCQLSSTLYNAIKDLNIEITERHHHSSPVAYVPKGEDATVSLQSNLDFKFVNNYEYPIRFETSHTPKSLTVSVYESE